MSDMDIELNGADQTASTEANAASAANDKDTSEEDSLVDYNEDDEIEAAQKAADQKALKEMLANNGLRIETFSDQRELNNISLPHFRRKMQCLQKIYSRKYRKKTYMK